MMSMHECPTIVNHLYNISRCPIDKEETNDKLNTECPGEASKWAFFSRFARRQDAPRRPLSLEVCGGLPRDGPGGNGMGLKK